LSVYVNETSYIACYKDIHKHLAIVDYRLKPWSLCAGHWQKNTE